MNSSENLGSSWSARTIVAFSNRIISELCNCGYCRKATRLARQAALTKEIPLPKESDHGFLALLGNHGDLALAVNDVKDSICRISLAKDCFVLSIFRFSPSPASVGKKLPPLGF